MLASRNPKNAYSEWIGLVAHIPAFQNGKFAGCFNVSKSRVRPVAAILLGFAATDSNPQAGAERGDMCVASSDSLPREKMNVPLVNWGSLLLGVIFLVGPAFSAARADTLRWTLHSVSTGAGASVTGWFDVQYGLPNVPYLAVTAVDITVGPEWLNGALDPGYNFTQLDTIIADMTSGTPWGITGIDFCGEPGCDGPQSHALLGMGFAFPQGLSTLGGTIPLVYDWRVMGGGFGPPNVGVYSPTSSCCGDAAPVISGYVTAAPETATPEPGSLVLVGSGLSALLGFMRRKPR